MSFPTVLRFLRDANGTLLLPVPVATKNMLQQVTWNVFFTTTQGNDLRYGTSVFSITIPRSPTSERFKWTANLHRRSSGTVRFLAVSHRGEDGWARFFPHYSPCCQELFLYILEHGFFMTLKVMPPGKLLFCGTPQGWKVSVMLAKSFSYHFV